MFTIPVSPKHFSLRVLAAATCLASSSMALAQFPFRSNGPVERSFTDVSGGSTELYSVDFHGPRLAPTEYVSVGSREIPGSGKGLYIARYSPTHHLISGAVYVPTGTVDMVGYSVDTLANGEILVAGEIEDDGYSPFGGQLNTFVLRLSHDLQNVVWARLLPGSLNHRPSVTARELQDGTIVVSHNKWPDAGHNGPGEAYVTHLDSDGELIRCSHFFEPNGYIWLADVRQEPNGGNFWAAGTYSAGPLGSQAILLNIDISAGCNAGEGGWLFPHPSFLQTGFSALYFDEVPSSPNYTMVAAGYAWTGDLFDSLQPRLVEVPAGGGGANWDYVYNLQMTPAPTALTVARASYPAGLRHIRIAGTAAYVLGGGPQKAQTLLVTSDDFSIGYDTAYGTNAPADTRFNDISDNAVMVGGRENAPAPSEAYYVKGVTDCAERNPVQGFGPGTLDFAYPDCDNPEQIWDVQLILLGSFTAEDTICRWTVGNNVGKPNLP